VNRPGLIIVGAGLSGLMTALMLRRTGLEVLVIPVDSRLPAGGWIELDASPLPPWQWSSSLAAMAGHGRRHLPALIAELGQATGVDCALAESDLLVVGRCAAPDVGPLRSAGVSWKRGRLHEFEPSLAMGESDALLVHGPAAADGTRLSRALAHYLGKRSVPADGRAAVRLEVAGNTVLGVELVDGSLLEADAVVVAAGASSAPLLYRSGLEPIVTSSFGAPVIVLRPHDLSLSTALSSDELWLSPQLDGTLIGGAWNSGPGDDDASQSDLFRLVRRWLPGLKPWDLCAHGRAVLSTDQAARPALGAYPRQRNLWINCAHEGVGPLPALAAAECLAGQLDGGALASEWAVRLAPLGADC